LGEAGGLAVALEQRAERFVSGAGHVAVVLLLTRMVARSLTLTEWVIELVVFVVKRSPRTQASNQQRRSTEERHLLKNEAKEVEQGFQKARDEPPAISNCR
jgi:hypothetical protein